MPDSTFGMGILPDREGRAIGDRQGAIGKARGNRPKPMLLPHGLLLETWR